MIALAYVTTMDSSKIPPITACAGRDAPVGNAVLPGFNLHPILGSGGGLKGGGQGKLVVVHRDAAKRPGERLTGVSSRLVFHQRIENVGLSSRRAGRIKGNRKIKGWPAGAEIGGVVASAPLNVGNALG